MKLYFTEKGYFKIESQSMCSKVTGKHLITVIKMAKGF